MVNDYRRQIVLDICNSFLVRDVHVRRTSINILEAVESGTGFIRAAVILNGTDLHPPQLFAHSRKNIAPEAFEQDMNKINSLLSGRNGGVVKHTMKSGEVTIVDDIEEFDDYVSADERIKSELCVPIRARGETIGALNIESSKKSAFGRGDITLLSTIAVQLGLLFNSHKAASEIASHQSISAIADQMTMEGE